MSFVLRISAYCPPFGEFSMKWRPKNALIGPFGQRLEWPGVSQVVAGEGSAVLEDGITMLYTTMHWSDRGYEGDKIIRKNPT
jgi:hypothetical protein